MRIVEGVEHSKRTLSSSMNLASACVRTTLCQAPVSRRRTVIPPPGCMFSPILNDETYRSSWIKHGIPDIIYEEPPSPEVYVNKLVYKVVSCDSPRRSSKLRIQNILQDNANYYSSLKPKNVHIVLSLSVPHAGAGGASLGEHQHIDSGPLRLWRLLIKAPSSTQDMRAAQCGLVFVSATKYERPGELLAGFNKWTAATYDAYLCSIPNRGEHVPGPYEPVAFFELAPGREQTGNASSWYGPLDFPNASGQYICIKILHGQIYRPMSDIQANRIVTEPNRRPSSVAKVSKTSVCGTYADRVEIDAVDERTRRTAMNARGREDTFTTMRLHSRLDYPPEVDGQIVSELENAFGAGVGSNGAGVGKKDVRASSSVNGRGSSSIHGRATGATANGSTEQSTASAADATAAAVAATTTTTAAAAAAASTTKKNAIGNGNGNGTNTVQGGAPQVPSFTDLYGKGVAIQYIGIYGANQVSTNAPDVIRALDKIESQLKEVEAWVVADASKGAGSAGDGDEGVTGDDQFSCASRNGIGNTLSGNAGCSRSSKPRRSAFQSKLMVNSMLMLRTERFVLRNAGRVCQCCGWSGGSHLLVKLMLLNKTGNPFKDSQARLFGAYDLLGRPLFARRDKRQWIDDFDLRGSQRLQLIVRYLLEVVSTRFGEEHIKRGVVWQLLFERKTTPSSTAAENAKRERASRASVAKMSDDGGAKQRGEGAGKATASERSEEMSYLYRHSCSDIMGILRNDKRGRKLVTRAFGR